MLSLGKQGKRGKRMGRKRNFTSSREIYSSSRQTKWPRKKSAIIIVGSVLAALLLSFGVIFFSMKLFFHSFEHQDLDTDLNALGISPDTMEQYHESEVTNIALFGVDTRDMSSSSGRSDALMVLSIDRVHNSVKLISIARDSYVTVEGHGKTKITHAHAYGGPQLAVKTLNQNFGLDIQDYVTVNFSQLANMIDYVGGVTIHVTEAERQVTNKYIDELNQIGVPTAPLEQTGDVRLTGGQAVAYSRDRYTGTDVERAQRQREVLMALFDSAKRLNFTQYPGLIRMVLSQSKTSLTEEEMMSIGLWAITSNPQMKETGLPTKECNAKGQTINGTWYFVYDLTNAADILHRFIYEDIQPK